MKTRKILALILCLVLVSVSMVSCDYETDTKDKQKETTSTTNNQNDNQQTEETPSTQNSSNDKEKVINAFMTYGEYSDGVYSFRKRTTTGNCAFSYSFSYKPEIDRFNCNVLVTTYGQNYPMYDYGAVTFGWGDIDNALFYGYHELENIALIEFYFNGLNPKSDMTFGNYQYQVESNSFQNLTNQNDINSYANTCFSCVNQSLLYAQSILSGYTSSVTLW